MTEATPYLDALVATAAKQRQRWTVPGHQGQHHRKLAEVFGPRIVELDLPPLTAGIDLPENEQPTAKDHSLQLAADCWGVHAVHWCTNGASQANMACVLALGQLDGPLLAQRNVHTSVLDGLTLSGSECHWLTPSIDPRLQAANGVTANQVDTALSQAAQQGKPYRAVYIVSPSYFGAVSDIAAISHATRRHGALLIVDQAWGSHFGHRHGLPESAASQGADIVISSTHKLTGALTQAAMLHIAHGPHAEQLTELTGRALALVTSTSVSSILQASLDIARAELQHGPGLDGSLHTAAKLRDAIDATGVFTIGDRSLLQADDVIAIDPLRVVIDTTASGMSGWLLRQQLADNWGIDTEMATDTSVVAVIGAGSQWDTAPFAQALNTLAKDTPDRPGNSAAPAASWVASATRALGLRQAHFSPCETVDANQAVGRISADTLAAYPPGIANVMAGERLTEDVIGYLRHVAGSATGHVRGAVDGHVNRLRVVLEP